MKPFLLMKMSFVFQLVFHFSLFFVALHATKETTSAVKDECAKEMPDHVVNSKGNKCCSDFLGCSCIKALCKAEVFHLEKDCLADSLYKSCTEEYQKTCSSVTEANFPEKCKGSDKDNWGKKPSKPNFSLLIPFIIVAVFVLFLGIALSCFIVQWYILPESNSKKSNEIGTIQSKHKSRSEGSKRKSNSSKRRSGVAQDKSKSKTKPKGKMKIKDKNAIKSVFHAKSPKTRPNQSQAGSFDSRAFTSRKVKVKAIKGRVTKQTYAKLKKALM